MKEGSIKDSMNPLQNPGPEKEADIVEANAEGSSVETPMIDGPHFLENTMRGTREMASKSLSLSQEAQCFPQVRL